MSFRADFVLEAGIDAPSERSCMQSPLLQSDVKIQNMLQHNFSKATILCIAHRLETSSVVFLSLLFLVILSLSWDGCVTLRLMACLKSSFWSHQKKNATDMAWVLVSDLDVGGP